jgi:hypothetical protein
MQRSSFSRRCWLCLILLPLLPAPVQAFPFGAGTCDAEADGSFMSSRTHHPSDDGGFALRFDRDGYYAGETLQVTLAHPGEVFTGFLLYAEDGVGLREGLFSPAPDTTFTGGLPAECSSVGHTITHDDNIVRTDLILTWTAPAVDAVDLVFRALVLRADPMAQIGTDFYEVEATLVHDPDGVFRDRFE